MEQSNYLIRPPERPAFPPFVKYDGDSPIFSPEICQYLIDRAEDKGMRPGTIGNGGNDTFYEDKEYRSVELAILDSNDIGLSLRELRDRIEWTNNDFYQFDVHGLLEGVQILKYTEGNGHYRWHQDYGGGYSSNRKLTVMVQLSDPEEYEGCRLKLFTQEEFEVPTLARGSGVIFPSWQPHCVTPITSGTRYALVAWVHGPRFR